VDRTISTSCRREARRPTSLDRPRETPSEGQCPRRVTRSYASISIVMTHAEASAQLMGLRLTAGVYAALCAASLILLGAAVFGWFGVEPDPIGAAFALLMAMPWSLLLGQLENDQPWKIVLLLAAFMAINWLIIAVVGLAIRKFGKANLYPPIPEDGEFT
jgi:hypothetical protein